LSGPSGLSGTPVHPAAKCARRGEISLRYAWAFGVPEVWIWERGELRACLLREGAYPAAPRSRLLPGVDLALLASFVERIEGIDSDTMRAVRAAVRAAVRGRPALT